MSANLTLKNSNCHYAAIHKLPVKTLHRDTGLSGLLTTVRNWLAKRKKQRIDRHAFQHMLALDDAMLRDIGVTRDDVKWASKLPLHMNASQELERLRRKEFLL